MNCKNCNEIVRGNYCNNCGQRTNIERITISSFMYEVVHSVFQIDKGFLYTCTQLLIKPGLTIKDFLKGKRKSHFKPIGYVLTLSTLYFLLAQLLGENTWMNDVVLGFTESAQGNKNNRIEVPVLFTWLSKNFAYTTILLLPVFSFASYIAFKNFAVNYIEHLVLNAYITGQQAVFYSFFIILKKLIKIEILELIPVVLAVLYTFWVFWGFFNEGNRLVNILRTIIVYILYLIFCLGLLFLFWSIQGGK
ncbi:DUF3667 domain-containing protein [Tenacibaculum sp. 190524A02b]|uniref:DUF3667 domain-containing protein n=1 Tax=Tenacibaculum vairaonense TaxID=3137860 RepID=UPI0031FB4B49